jgi:hypothetical protein
MALAMKRYCGRLGFPGRARVAGLLLALACLAMPAGCGKDRGAGVVPVSGRVTYHGGGWPNSGYLDFCPVKKADGFPLAPGVAKFDADGNFVVKTEDRDGLMPGQYRVGVRCWDRPPTDGQGGKNILSEQNAAPDHSGLEVTVEPGSQPITLNWDIPK